MNKGYILLLSMLLAGCSATDYAANKKATEVDYTAIYIVHADADYTYHQDGRALKADEEIMDEAMALGRAAIHGEVIIFHQKPEKKRFLFFPGKDRIWYHFREGKLIGKGAYSPHQGGLRKEAQIYEQRAAEQGRKMFFYFGHEIPSKAFFSYHRSRPKATFNTETFADDLPLFERKFDLMLLSTCNNANPYMISELTGKSEYLIASPRNLHLSYMNTEGIKMLEELALTDTKAVADTIAERSFAQLSENLQTMVTVGTYDLDSIGAYIKPFAKEYTHYLEELDQSTLFKDNTDCEKLQIYSERQIPKMGIALRYASPAFGRDAGQDRHSPWGCKR